MCHLLHLLEKQRGCYKYLWRFHYFYSEIEEAEKQQ